MREIVVVSGKGGTGKTSILAAFAHLAASKVVCDLDVDAPDLHILLDPEPVRRKDFFSGHEARIDPAACESCGICASVCRFNAISPKDGKFVIDPVRCEGCKVCVVWCPEGAVKFPERRCGEWYRSETRFGPMIHARLSPGAENSGRLVTLLRREARALAEQNDLDLILCDGSPGIGCPVISSLGGANLAVAVTEPTPSGIHDLVRVAELCGHFRVPVAVIVNKHDLNPERTAAIESLCRDKGYILAGKLPFDPAMTKAMLKRKAITEIHASPLAGTLREIWNAVERAAPGADRAGVHETTKGELV